MSVWPISFDDIVAARDRIRAFIPPTPLRHYPALDRAVGHGVTVLVKHENHNPTNAFKARNALSKISRLPAGCRGVVAATRGNHGQGVAWAAGLHGVPVVICVPRGNNPEKNEAMRDFGAEVIEEGRDYDESVAAARRLMEERGLLMVHSTNDPDIIAGAGTITHEILEEAPEVDAMVVAVGGGSQAVGALVAARTMHPGLPVYGVQAAGAAAIHDSWHAGEALALDRADTFADGLATRSTYELTFGALREGLAGFGVVSEAELAEAVRVLMRTTHNLAEGAGAAGLAGLCARAEELAGKTVAVILSGSNIDAETLRRITTGEL